MSKPGAYIEGGPSGGPSGIAAFEHWVGQPVESLLCFIGRDDWQHFDKTLSEVASFSATVDRPVVWSVPLIPTIGSLEVAATGAYNDHYRHAAEVLAETRPQDSVLYVRTGWEFNGNWFSWAAAGHEQAFIGAWHQFVDTFRSVSDRFQFDWCVNLGGTTMNPEKAYPGNAYVDVISMDVYYNIGWDSPDPNAAWDYTVTRPYGLQWHQDFAAAQGKPTSYTEWGVLNRNGGPYVEKAAEWFESHDVLYQHYWDAQEYQLSNGQFPNTAAAYQNSFGYDSPANGTATSSVSSGYDLQNDDTQVSQTSLYYVSDDLLL